MYKRQVFSSSDEVVAITPATYNAAAFGQAVANALSSKASSILPKPVKYHAAVNNQVCTLSLRYNESPLRYDFQGMWNRTGSGAGVGPKQIVRDYRHLWVSTTYPEYVVTPKYSFEGRRFTLRINGVHGETHTGIVGLGTSAFQSGSVTVPGEVTILLEDYQYFLHSGGFPAFHVHVSIPANPPISQLTDVGYNGATRSFDLFTLLGNDWELSFETDPMITSQEVTSVQTGLTFNASGNVIKGLSLIHISEPTRQAEMSEAVF